MRVGFDGKRAFHNFRGLGNYSRTLIESLIVHYPQLQCFLYTPPYKDERAIAWRKMLESMNVCLPTTAIGETFPSLWRSFMMPEDIKREGLDLYHGLSHELPMGITKLNIKKVVTIHDLIFMRFPQYFPFIDRVVYKRKFQYSCSVADKVIAICEQTKQDLIDFLDVPESKIEVVYQSCNPRFFVPSEESKIQEIRAKYLLDKEYILNVGAIEPRKNTLTLVKAFHSISSSIKEDLILVGQGKKYKDEIEDYIVENNLVGRVRIISNVPMADLPAIYTAAKLFVYPSHFEGFGIPIIESLFSKTPVITSKGSCFPEAGGPNSIYIDPDNSQEIAHEIKSILEDRDRQVKMIEEGYRFVQKFHWSKTSENLFTLYAKMINSQ
jgi:glycosyltransferase involved in cell wall biosynthesis